ncbi:energy transducer TonB [Parahaliea mediterranea]|uniref:energy transducer TonB n=1 Tax=Parahaliea mediterranea TaxID=651086 RepID=UPI000E2FA24E|nr:energy transducer TonB [Parahaliea mediterranea]
MKQPAKRWFLTLGLFSVLASACLPLVAAGELGLSGLAMHRETGRDIYVGALRSEQALVQVADIANASGVREMEFRIVARRTSMRSLLGGILLQAEVATGAAPSAATVDFANAIMGSVQGSLYTNDSFTLRSEGDVVALVDGHEVARSPSPVVFDYFLAGWIDERGASTAFRDSLLATDIDIDLRATYASLKPSADRLAAVNAWGGAAATGSEPEPEPKPKPKPKPKPETVPAPAPQQQVAAATAAQPAAAEPAPTPAKQAATQPALAEAVKPVPAAVVAATEAAAASAPVQAASTPSIAMAQPKPVISPEPAPAVALAAETAPADPNDITRLSIIEYSQRLAAFNSMVFRMVNLEIRYPRAAIRRNIQGELELDVVLDAQGALLDVAVARSSGHGMLDDSALKAAREAFEDPLADPLDKVAIAEYSGDGQRLVIPVPVNFVLTE